MKKLSIFLCVLIVYAQAINASAPTSSQNFWPSLRPILAGASLVGGFFTSAFSLYRIKNLKKPAPQPTVRTAPVQLIAPIKRKVQITPLPQEENPEVQQIDQHIANIHNNVECLKAIKAAATSDDKIEAEARKKQIQDNINKLDNILDNARKESIKYSLTWHLTNVDPDSLKIMFGKPKDERNQALPRNVSGRKSQYKLNAVRFVNIYEETLAQLTPQCEQYTLQRIEKQEQWDKQQQEKQEKYEQAQRSVQERQAQQEYDRDLARHNHELALQRHQEEKARAENAQKEEAYNKASTAYNKAVKRNRLLLGTGAGLIGAGGALLWLHKKK
jgi:hypothetical protein